MQVFSFSHVFMVSALDGVGELRVSAGLVFINS